MLKYRDLENSLADREHELEQEKIKHTNEYNNEFDKLHKEVYIEKEDLQM